ncbi:MAG: zinc metalloprotease HtpX [Nanoarchaeota archaeon]|nr:zinc metalloprotease HtpX [Nanoarchaeota archaeon]
MDNTIKTVLFLGLLTGIILGIGYMLGPYGLLIGLVFAVVMNFVSYFFSDKIVLAMYRAKEVSEKDQPELYKIVREVAHLANIPMPKLYIVSSSNPNAFATGRNPNHAAVAVTTGIMDLLEKDELKGVIAHEISHVKNRDILIATVAATLAGIISYIGIMARWSAIFGGMGGDDDNNIISILVLGIITPIMAFLIQMAISRSREFEADKSAAKILHNPHGLIKALDKLENGVKTHPLKFGSKAGASLFIVNPFSAKGFTNMLSTHPPMEERIKRLKNLI